MDYTKRCLAAAGLRYGPAHTEVILTEDGPRLVEINSRWHAANTYPLVTACYGYDSLTATVEAFMEPGERATGNTSRSHPQGLQSNLYLPQRTSSP